jgi:hypothetical protein
MSLVLPLSKWPDEDQTMWRALVQPSGPLDDQGALSHLRATSLATLEVQYGRWLGWIAAEESGALQRPPLSARLWRACRLGWKLWRPLPRCRD